jgi:hypothetical protein
MGFRGRSYVAWEMKRDPPLKAAYRMMTIVARLMGAPFSLRNLPCSKVTIAEIIS